VTNHYKPGNEAAPRQSSPERNAQGDINTVLSKERNGTSLPQQPQQKGNQSNPGNRSP
jgi:hypothetical protein